MTNLTMIRGDTEQLTIPVLDNTGAAMDLTDYTVKFTVKKHTNDNDNEAVIGPLNCTVATPANGIALLTITSTQTNIEPGTYYYDVQINNGSTVYTVATSGTVTISDDVTKTWS